MDADKIKDFALYNFEKLIVVLVMAMSGFLVYTVVSLSQAADQPKVRLFREWLLEEGSKQQPDVAPNPP